MVNIRENIEKINKAKQEAAMLAGRRGDDVLLCAVTKTRSPDEINEAVRAGVTDIGENKVQEIIEKYDLVDPVRWHMIGHLQTNKVKYIVDKVALIHSVDSMRLAEEIDRRAGQCGKTMDILVQVNSAMEESKFGVRAGEAESLINGILKSCINIKVKGLMCMAPFEGNPKDAAAYFAAVKVLFDKCKKEIRHERLDFSVLSMGMSHDFEVAIGEGSNLVRIGTAIFGERSYKK
ncbi:MAG: YggS family pyridoxal phosphate-dependent enzyme [Clostridiales bacterium]|nr:YggS family pyridoxal phosphate-dependent enzyme [Clostridiales bacterium]